MYVHRYKNGEALGEGDTSVWECKNRPENKCLMGKNSFKVEPGLYWMIYSENGKIFSAEWFEVRSYKLGEGRFAKGQKYYAYLPTTQMAQIELDPKEDKVNVKVGLAGEKEVGDKYSVTKTLKAELKHNGKAFAGTPGKNPHKVNLYPNTTLETVNLSLLKNNSTLKYKDLKPGKYELNISLDGKGYRKFIFEMKDGKIVYQGRQKESTQPVERMIASEKSYWLWNTYTKEPTYTIPTVDLSTP